MKRNQLVTKIWIMFTLNYRGMDFIDYICEKTGKGWLKGHLREKFDDLYDRYGNKAVMTLFYCELDEDLKDALVDYAVNVYAPEGMLLKEEDIKLLND